MAFSTIAQALIAVGKPIIKNLWQLTKDNLDDLNSRVIAVEAGASKVVIFDQVVDLSNVRVGEIRHSLLTEAQYRDRYGVEWNLLKGQSLSGKDLSSLFGGTSPDARGRFLRMLNNGSGINPDNSAMGVNQGSQFGSHNHAASFTFNVTQKLDNPGSNSREEALSGGITQNVSVATVGGNETRSVATTVNIFIRENDIELTYVGVFRSPSNLDLVSGRISNLEAGDSGTLSIDLKKGASLGSMTTMLNSDLSIASGAGSFATSSEASFLSTFVLQNDFLRFDITGLQTKQTRFHISFYAEVS